jgi:DNA-binding CsgD family transcriptional regulator
LKVSFYFYLITTKNNSLVKYVNESRRKKKNGNYITFFFQSSFYERFENGMPSKSVARLIDVSMLNNSSHVNWTFEANNLDEVAFRKEINKAYDGFFTLREVKIIKELISSSATKLISEKLEISEHTVATHRKSIYKKSNCHNPSELISFCKNIGLTKS